MKKIFTLLVTIGLLFGSMNLANGQVELSNESMYGMELDFRTNTDYPGIITIEGVYVYRDGEDYIFTLLYDNGKLVTVNDNGVQRVKSSFFNPPSGSVVKVSWINNFDRITSTDKKVQYRVNQEEANQIDYITIFLYDEIYGSDNDKNMSCYMDLEGVDLASSPTADEIVNGYELTTESIEFDGDDQPSVWAANNIEELILSSLLRESAFESYTEGVTRERFVYLVVTLYEELIGEEVVLQDSIQFDDTMDEYALKAAQIGITNGIGDNKFGPEIILNREQMVTFVIRTLELAGVELGYDNEDYNFDDHDSISNWAKTAVYTAKKFAIMNGVGENNFSPNGAATNEQALIITHRLLETYGGLNWYSEVDGDRFYLEIDDKLYKIELSDNVILDYELEVDNIYFESFDDVETIINVAYTNNENLEFYKHDNPNFEGMLIEYDFDCMSVDVEINYRGVDKYGETTTIDINALDSDLEYDATVVTKEENDEIIYEGFESIDYYDIDGNRFSGMLLPTKEIFTELGINYTLEYDMFWEIYIIRFEAE